MTIKGSNFSCLIILTVAVRLLSSCAPESCIEETTSYVNTTFYKSTTNKLTAPDSITVFGIGRDTSRLYNMVRNVSTIKLPLDASAETCGFIIKINGESDTLRFIYSGYPHLVSKACGITYFFSVDSLLVSGSATDTIIIRNKNVTTFNEENIRIYY